MITSVSSSMFSGFISTRSTPLVNKGVKREKPSLTEGCIAVFDLPHVDSKVVSADEGLCVAVKRQRIDMVGMCISEYSFCSCMKKLSFIGNITIYCWESDLLVLSEVTDSFGKILQLRTNLPKLNRFICKGELSVNRAGISMRRPLPLVERMKLLLAMGWQNLI